MSDDIIATAHQVQLSTEIEKPHGTGAIFKRLHAEIQTNYYP